MGFFSSVGSMVRSAVSSVYNTVRSVASKAIDFLADRAEQVVVKVKETWKVVGPYLKKLSPILTAAANAAPHPWLKAAILLLNTATQALLALENSPILHKVEAAIQWAAKWARQYRQKMSEAEEAEARVHQENLRAARADLPTQAHDVLDMSQLITNYLLVNTALGRLLESGALHDFEHYLRLRATQKLLKSVEAVFSQAQQVSDISTDDMFMLAVAENLLSATPHLTADEAARLDGIIFRRHGQKLLPFVFEEMTRAWQLSLSAEEARWKVMNHQLSKDEVLCKRLELAAKLSELTSEEAAMLGQLRASLPALQAEFRALGEQNRLQASIVHASEGFMQLQEKSEQQLQADDQLYLLGQSQEIADILIEFMEHRRPLSDMSLAQRALVTDYANIFRVASEARAQTLVVECNA